MNSFNVVPLTPEQLPAAARLLAHRHRRDRGHLSMLPARYEQPTELLPWLEGILALPFPAGALAYPAIDPRPAGEREPVAFVLGSAALHGPDEMNSVYLPPRYMRIPFAGSAALPGFEYDAVRALYAAVSPFWVERGIHVHYINVYSHRSVELAAWRSLGFGQQAVWGMMAVPSAPQAAVPVGVTVREAGADDFEDVLRLVMGNNSYHCGAPIWMPSPPETAGRERRHQRNEMSEPGRVAFMAERDGHAFALQTFRDERDDHRLHLPDSRLHLDDGFTESDARGSGAGTALLARGLDLAREKSIAWCTVTWDAPNLSGAAFWQRAGFRPFAYRLARTVDPRITWRT